MLCKKMEKIKYGTIGMVLRYLSYAWIVVFVILPFIVSFFISFSKTMLDIPPYSSLISFVDSSIVLKVNLKNYQNIAIDSSFIDIYINSLKFAFASCFICLLIGFPLAYSIFHLRSSSATLCLMILLLPSWISFAIRVYSWVEFLRTDGYLFMIFNMMGLNAPNIMNSQTAVLIGMVHSYLPFMLLPLYSSISKIDRSLIEASYDLGCHPIKTFFKIILPLTVPGIITGCVFVFIPALGEFVIPELLGDGETSLIGQLIRDELFCNRDWAMSAAISMVTLVFISPALLFLKKYKFY